jgi:hypothetical protein
MDYNHSHNQVFALFPLFAVRFTFWGYVSKGNSSKKKSLGGGGTPLIFRPPPTEKTSPELNNFNIWNLTLNSSRLHTCTKECLIHKIITDIFHCSLLNRNIGPFMSDCL